MIAYADEIKAAVSMKDVAAMYGFEADRSGNICCPFHGDSKPSMHIYAGTRGWWCFVCNEGGDVIDFVRRHFGLGFRDACRKLNADFGLGLPIGDKLTPAQQAEADRRIAERRRAEEKRRVMHERIVAKYHIALDFWIWLDEQRRRYKPRSPDEPIDDRYAFAVRTLPKAAYALDVAECELWRQENA